MYCIMNAKKKLLSLGLAASLAAVAIAGSSLAYFTDKDENTNTFTVGNVNIDVTETSDDTNGYIPGPPKADGSSFTYDHIVPGVIYAKDVDVTIEENSNDAYKDIPDDLHCAIGWCRSHGGDYTSLW